VLASLNFGLFERIAQVGFSAGSLDQAVGTEEDVAGAEAAGLVHEAVPFLTVLTTVVVGGVWVPVAVAALGPPFQVAWTLAAVPRDLGFQRAWLEFEEAAKVLCTLNGCDRW